MTPPGAARPLGPRFDIGDSVRVLDLRKPGHVRTPDYVIGHVVALYRVRFPMAELWGAPARHSGDTLCIELYDQWLERAGEPS